MTGRVFCTSITSNYLGFIGPLRESLTKSGNIEELIVLIADFDISSIGKGFNGIQFISLKEINNPLVADMAIYFSPGELANALKPFCIEYVLNKTAVDQLIYIDCDLFFINKLPDLFATAEMSNKKIIFTPHITKALSMLDRIPKEIDIVDMGILNGGFIAVKKDPDTFEILQWMKERFAYFGFDDRKNGYFLDQKLLPLLITLFPSKLGIDFSENLNIAFWNAHERNVYEKDNTYWIDNKPVIFFHMSGVKINGKNNEICQYLSEFENQTLISRSPWLLGVLVRYRSLIDVFSTEITNWPYKFVSYNNITLFPAIRRFYFKNRKMNKYAVPEAKLIMIHKLKLLNRYIRKTLKIS